MERKLATQRNALGEKNLLNSQSSCNILKTKLCTPHRLLLFGSPLVSEGHILIHSCHVPIQKIILYRVIEMARWLRALIAPAEDVGSVSIGGSQMP